MRPCGQLRTRRIPICSTVAAQNRPENGGGRWGIWSLARRLIGSPMLPGTNDPAPLDRAPSLAEKLDEMTLHDETGDPRDEGYMAAVRELPAWIAANPSKAHPNARSHGIGFKIGDAFPAHDAVARWAIVLAMAANDAVYLNVRMVEGNLPPELNATSASSPRTSSRRSTGSPRPGTHGLR